MKKLIIILIFSVFLISIVSAETSYCCERTVDGTWCQNAPESSCDGQYNSVPTSCESTSYCRLGCCYDNQDGTCTENSPEKVCNDGGGVWEDDSECDIPQCSLGCCLIGDQAAFVTQTRCKRLSSLYGLEIDFRTNIGNEVQCIASATSDVKGACVFEKEYEKTCLFVTKRKCQEIDGASFYEDVLCSSSSLGTNCGMTKQTKCVEGKDEVYLVDSCGNLANIYDASKIENENYWSKIYEKSESCNPTKSNADSSSCGNCDYYLGSTCKSFKRGEDKVRPNYGDNICRDLSCEYDGKKYEHGETWCVDSPGIKDNLPGSRYFRLVCYNGDVTVEACADFRQEVCIESEVGGFRTAGCRVNMWQGCTAYTEKKDCENTDKGDCQWVNNKCAPKSSPGFEFWNTEGDALSLCSEGSKICVVKYEKQLGGDKKAVEGEECLGKAWQNSMMQQCVNLGDCGTSKNYLGYQGE